MGVWESLVLGETCQHEQIFLVAFAEHIVQLEALDLEDDLFGLNGDSLIVQNDKSIVGEGHLIG